MLSWSINSLREIPVQKYINALIGAIGLLANLIALGQYFGAIQTSPTGSNFYVNSREYLAWSLIAAVYSIGLINAYIRRRWRRLYGNKDADHSVVNFLYIDDTISNKGEAALRRRNFQRDFSFIYLFTSIFTFLFSRAISASENATSLTPSPWGDVLLSSFINVFVALGMMVITSMFDFALSMFVGDGNPENP